MSRSPFSYLFNKPLKAGRSASAAPRRADHDDMPQGRSPAEQAAYEAKTEARTRSVLKRVMGYVRADQAEAAHASREPTQQDRSDATARAMVAVVARVKGEKSAPFIETPGLAPERVVSADEMLRAYSKARKPS